MKQWLWENRMPLIGGSGWAYAGLATLWSTWASASDWLWALATLFSLVAIGFACFAFYIESEIALKLERQERSPLATKERRK